MDYYEIIVTAIDYIEENLFDEDLVSTVYKEVHVSKFHFHRMFYLVAKFTLGQYIKRRRFTEVAKMLTDTEDTILNIAVCAGYNSHEAFTRAFRNYFGATPSAYRKTTDKQTFLLLDRFSIDVIEFTYHHLKEPEIVFQDELRLYGVLGQVELDAKSIDGLWHRFRLKSRRENTGAGYTVWLDSDLRVQDLKDGNPYDCFVGVTSKLELDNLVIPRGSYAKFTLKEDFSKIYFLYAYIYFAWFKKSEYEFSSDMILEYYDSEFDFASQNGSMSILVPIKRKDKK